MPINLKWLLKLPFGRLSRRVATWVFVSVIVIEAIIFFPSFQNRKKELLANIRGISTAKITMMMDLAKDLGSEEDLLDHLSKLEMDPTILGGSVYRTDGTLIGRFGELPELTLDQIRETGQTERVDADGTRYDAAWEADRLGLCTLVIRHDATSVRAGLMAYFLRIAGLVVIISLFVTIGTLVALEPLVLTPILKLRGDLINFGEAIRRDEEPPEFHSSTVNRPDELGEVISAFVTGRRQITEAIAERKQAERSLQESLQQVEAYSKALNNEMEQGRRMQANFLPERLPQKAGWAFEAFIKPARQVSGDFYDLFELQGNQVGIVIADVCDKGVGAALFMALFRSLIRVFSGQTALEGLKLPGENARDGQGDFSLVTEGLKQPEDRELPGRSGMPGRPYIPDDVQAGALEAVRLTNKYIVQNHGDLGMFATLFFGVLCPQTGRLDYINGGHDPLFVMGSAGTEKRLAPTGPAVGVIADASFGIEQIVLDPGHILFGYTDGVIDARSPSDRLFGRERLDALLAEPVDSAKDLIERVRSCLSAYLENAAQEDDITLVAVERRLS